MPPVVPVLLILLVIRSIRLKILIRVNPEHRSKALIPVNPRLLQNPDNLILILVKRLLNLLKPADKQHVHPRIGHANDTIRRSKNTCFDTVNVCSP